MLGCAMSMTSSPKAAQSRAQAQRARKLYICAYLFHCSCFTIAPYYLLHWVFYVDISWLKPSTYVDSYAAKWAALGAHALCTTPTLQWPPTVSCPRIVLFFFFYNVWFGVYVCMHSICMCLLSILWYSRSFSCYNPFRCPSVCLSVCARKKNCIFQQKWIYDNSGVNLLSSYLGLASFFLQQY